MSRTPWAPRRNLGGELFPLAATVSQNHTIAVVDIEKSPASVLFGSAAERQTTPFNVIITTPCQHVCVCVRGESMCAWKTVQSLVGLATLIADFPFIAPRAIALLQQENTLQGAEKEAARKWPQWEITHYVGARSLIIGLLQLLWPAQTVKVPQRSESNALRERNWMPFFIQRPSRPWYNQTASSALSKHPPT